MFNTQGDRGELGKRGDRGMKGPYVSACTC